METLLTWAELAVDDLLQTELQELGSLVDLPGCADVEARNL